MVAQRDAQAFATSTDFHEKLEDESDRVWFLLKSFSLTIVKDGAASMHRLLQVMKCAHRSCMTISVMHGLLAAASAATAARPSAGGGIVTMLRVGSAGALVLRAL